MSQLALPLQLADHAVFASFHASGNETLVATLQALAARESGQGCWLWGAPATGKTHLLQAVCDSAGDESIYLPLATVFGAGPAILQGLADRSIVCIDDIDTVAGDPDWDAVEGVLAHVGAPGDADGTTRVGQAIFGRQFSPAAGSWS